MSSQPKVDVEALHRLVRDATTSKDGEQALPRMAALVGTRETVIFEEAVGPRIYDESLEGKQQEPQDPITLDSIFWLASQTKLITSLAAALLIEKGVLTLDSHAEEFVPELKDLHILTGFDDDGKEIMEKPKTKITMRMLFTHTAGTVFCAFSPIHERYRLKHGLERPWVGPKGPRTMYTEMPLKADPGSEFNYALSNDLLALAVEGASGMDFEDYCKKHIFSPLGIDDMVWRLDPKHTEKLVNLCLMTEDGKGYKGVENGGVTRPECCSGGGGLYTSPRSYMKILRALLNDGVFHDTGVRIAKKETVDLIASDPLQDYSNLKREVWEKYNKGDLPVGFGMDSDEDRDSRRIGLAVSVMQKDVPGGRRKGAFYGAGYTSCFWLVDRKAGVTYTFLPGIIPGKDSRNEAFRAAFERQIYADIE